MFEKLLKEWAEAEGFGTWSQDHAAVLRNLAGWLDANAVGPGAQAQPASVFPLIPPHVNIIDAARALTPPGMEFVDCGPNNAAWVPRGGLPPITLFAPSQAAQACPPDGVPMLDTKNYTGIKND